MRETRSLLWKTALHANEREGCQFQTCPAYEPSARDAQQTTKGREATHSVQGFNAKKGNTDMRDIFKIFIPHWVGDKRFSSLSTNVYTLNCVSKTQPSKRPQLVWWAPWAVEDVMLTWAHNINFVTSGVGWWCGDIGHRGQRWRHVSRSTASALPQKQCARSLKIAGIRASAKWQAGPAGAARWRRHANWADLPDAATWRRWTASVSRKSKVRGR